MIKRKTTGSRTRIARSKRIAEVQVPGTKGRLKKKRGTVRYRAFVVRDERSAFRYLEEALGNKLDAEKVRIRFDNWPVIRVSLVGKGYDSTITADMAEALVSLQQALNRAYARFVHSSTNARALSAEEKRRIQFKAKVEKGSSLIECNLTPYAHELFQALVGKMEPGHLVVTILGLGLLGAGTVAYKAFLRHRSQDKTIEEEAKAKMALSAEETRRLELVAKALSGNPQLRHTKEDFEGVHQDVLRGVSDANTLTVQGVTLSRESAQKIAKAPRTASRPVQLNGTYIIQKTDWKNPDEVRLWLQNVDTGHEFVAALPGDGVSDEQRERVMSAEWGRKHIYMSINATELRGEITTAHIVGAEWPSAEDEAVPG